MSVKRIYLVKPTDSELGKPRLIRAATQAQALRHATNTTLACSVASTDEVAQLVGDGVKVESA